jgi:hypothetical protein
MPRLRAPSSVQVGSEFPLPADQRNLGTKRRRAQGGLGTYIELVTRIAVVPLGPGGGLLRDALSNLYSLFPTTRDILRRYGPGVADPNTTASTASAPWPWQC